jgi:hypothetical protein
MTLTDLKKAGRVDVSIHPISIFLLRDGECWTRFPNYFVIALFCICSLPHFVLLGLLDSIYIDACPSKAQSVWYDELWCIFPNFEPKLTIESLYAFRRIYREICAHF